MRFGGTKVQIEDARQNGFADVVFPLKDLCITQPPSQNTLPGGNTGLGRPQGPMEAYGWARVTLPCTPSQAPGAKDMPRMRLGLVGGGISTPLSGRNPNLW